MSKILIVDDLKEIRMILSRILENQGYEYVEANNGEEALKLVRKEKPDLILLDIDMPEISGYEVCKKIRMMEEHKFTKIIFVSAHIDVNSVITGLETGGNDYIKKPFNPGELLARIKVHLSWKQEELLNEFKNEILRVFSMYFTHEIRTPLNGIIGFSELAKKNVDPETLDMLNTVTDSAMDLNLFIKKVLFLTRISQANSLEDINNTKDCLDGNSLFKDLTNKAKKKNIEIVNSTDFSNINLNCDLVKKAVNFTLEHSIEVSPKNSKIEIYSENLENRFNVILLDESNQINPNAENRLFDIFEIDIEHHHRGGLSLPIVKAIMDLYKGTVSIENQEEKGRKIILKFPNKE